MKVAILAGGVGSRLSEETVSKPKPMVEVGGRPILWHIMKGYAAQGFSDFVIALGYKGEIIKEWMINYAPLSANLTVHTQSGEVVHETPEEIEDWRVQLIDTGQHTGTGGRVKRLKEYIGNETFMLTWGDGVADIDIEALVKFHKSHGKLATVTAVRPPARFGLLEIEGDAVKSFTEKPQLGEGWINGAFFVLEPEVFDYVEGDETMWEKSPMETLAREGQLMAYKHPGFWQCMDTLRHRKILEDLWDGGQAPWKNWS